MKKKFVLIGSGHLAAIIAGAYAEGKLPDYELAAVMGMEREQTESVAAKAGCAAVYQLEDALALKPDYIVEAASVGAVQAYLEPIISAGINFVTLSIGVFADEAFHAKAGQLAAAHNVKIHLPSGAIGGYDVLRTITAMGEAERGSAKGETGGASMEFTMNKSRVNMGGTSLYEKCPAEGEPAVIFEGTAREAIQLLPGHVNVAVAAALATVGPDKMRVIINSDPNDPDDEMHSRIRADKASAHLIIRSVPADIAAWSVVALLNNLASPIQFA